MTSESAEAPAKTPPSRRGTWLRWFAKSALAVALLGLLVWSGKLDLARLTAIRPSVSLALLFASIATGMFIPAYRWWYLLTMQQVHVPFGRVLRMTWIGYLAAVILPGAAGGDVAKAWLVTRGQAGNRFRPLATVVVDRVLGLYCVLVLALVPVVILLARGGMTRGAWLTALVPLGGWVAMCVVFAALAWRPTHDLAMRLVPARFRQTVSDSLLLYYSSPRGLWWVLALSLVSNVLMVGAFYFAAHAMDLDVPWTDAFLVGPLAILANAIPLTPGGIGTAEAVSEQAFGALGAAGGAEIMLLVRAAILLTSLPAALFLSTAPSDRPNAG